MQDPIPKSVVSLWYSCESATASFNWKCVDLRHKAKYPVPNTNYWFSRASPTCAASPLHQAQRNVCKNMTLWRCGAQRHKKRRLACTSRQGL